MFGIDRKVVGSFEAIAERASTGNVGWIDFLYPGEMAVEHKSAGADLDAAMGQLLDYLPSLPHAEMPWLLIVCDFGLFRWQNLETREAGEFALDDLPDHLDLFWWLAGHAKPGEQHDTEEDANLKATALLEKVHDGLLDAGFDAHATREWVTRILFCLFADDTSIWDRALFHAYIARNTRADGSDLGPTVATIFQTLNTPPERRSKNLDDDLASFAYINGDLFARQLPIPACDSAIRDALLRACSFNWGRISPSIFGSLFQGVMEPRERRQIGAHYTTEENILRTIRPLFLDDLETELAAATSRPQLEAFHNKLGSLRFLDPACGCGNFLVVAYREIRRLETECLRRLATAGRRSQRQREGQRAMSLALLCKVGVDQFYGIEIEEFPALIARTALYLADHLANRDISAEFGEQYARFPIPAAPHIVVGNALRVDWNTVLPADQADYVFGNPPFVGRQYRTDEQRTDMASVFGEAKGVAVLDYVTCWLVRAADYLAPNSEAAFVATNSISQGENAAVLWPQLARRGVQYSFAHRTFAWASDARGKAHVHVVIVGMTKSLTPPKKKVIFEYETPESNPTSVPVASISPYLAEGPPLVVSIRRGGPLVDWAPKDSRG